MTNEREASLPTAVQLALQDGEIVTAIKQLRETTGCDLATAKARIERAAAEDPLLGERLAATRRAFRLKLILVFLGFDALLAAGLLLWWLMR